MNHVLERRDFLRGLALLGASGALPVRALARAAGEDWAQVRVLMDGLAPATLPGLVAAIGRGTGPAQYLSVGTLAKESAVKVDPDTLWRVYSMSKPITGIAAMMLVEDGRLKLDQPIADLIPAFKAMRVATAPDTSLDSVPAKNPITVRNLLTHTAGLGYSIVTKGPLLDEYLRLGITPGAISRTAFPGVPVSKTAPSLDEFANRLATLPLVAEPGTLWKYSVSLDLLGRVIEVASGKSFDAFLAERMFGPLGMTSTFWQVPASEIGRFTTNYFTANGGLIPLDPATTSIYLDKPAFPFGGAGLVMSARDYDKFLAMLLGQGALGRVRVMKPETVRLAMSNLLPPDVNTTNILTEGEGFGAGGRVSLVDKPGGQGKGTFGWGGAAATIGWVDPARGLRASGFAQYIPSEAFNFTRDFGKAVYASLA